MIFLKSKRLILRTFIDTDLTELFDYRNNEICQKYQRGQKCNIDGLQLLIKNNNKHSLDNDGKQQFAIALKADNSLIGDLVVFKRDNTLTIGYTISYKHQRNGYASEILKNLINTLHKKYPLCEIVALTDKNNIASIGLLNKLGFFNEGYSEEMDSIIFSLYSNKLSS